MYQEDLLFPITAHQLKIFRLDFHLKPLVTKVPHIIEDTSDILTWITEIKYRPENVLLVSFDVACLCPHIPHEEGTGIMKQFLNQKKVKDISTKSLCDPVSIILSEEVYHQ